MVTDEHILRLRKALQKGMSLSLAAAKAGMDRQTARKYRRLARLPSEVRMEHTWRTREDPFEGVWAWVEEQLAQNPRLEAKTLFAALQRLHPGRFPDGQLRTLQRRVKQWRAERGPAKEVFFAQVHHPGRLAASDFTHCSDLGVTVAGSPFPHLVYHFVLTYSNWEAGTVCFSESYESLSEGLQNALWELGGVPQLHRTDRLTAAVQPRADPEVFKRRYQALLGHYGLQGQAIQAGKGNENGDVEQRHRRFKQALDQALMLRGSRASRRYLRAVWRSMPALAAASDSDIPFCKALRKRRICSSVTIGTPFLSRSPDGIHPYTSRGILIVAGPRRVGTSNCRRWGGIVVAHHPAEADPELLERIPPGDVLQASLAHVRRRLDHHLRQHGGRAAATMAWDAERGRPLLRFAAPTLLGALWLQLADAVTHQRSYGRCRTCGKWFEVAPEASRSHKRFCSTTCRSNAYRQRQDVARRLHFEEKKTFEEIAEELDCKVQAAKRWITGVK